MLVWSTSIGDSVVGNFVGPFVVRSGVGSNVEMLLGAVVGIGDGSIVIGKTVGTKVGCIEEDGTQEGSGTRDVDGAIEGILVSVLVGRKLGVNTSEGTEDGPTPMLSFGSNSSSDVNDSSSLMISSARSSFVFASCTVERLEDVKVTERVTIAIAAKMTAKTPRNTVRCFSDFIIIVNS